MRNTVNTLNINSSSITMSLSAYFFMALYLTLFMETAVATSLSEVYLSSKDKEVYSQYYLKVKQQSEESYDDLQIKRHYPKLTLMFAQSLDDLLKLVQVQGWNDISYMLTGNFESCESENSFAWGSSNSNCQLTKHNWIAPILHHKGDLALKHSVEIDFPLFVEGNLIIDGNLILKHENNPLVVTGDLRAKHLLYELDMSDQGTHLLVRGKTTLNGYAFIDGRTETFDHDLESKAIFSLSLNKHSPASYKLFYPSRKSSQVKLLPIPDSPALVRPGILHYNSFYKSTELDVAILEKYLLADIEPFTTAYPRLNQQSPWSNFLQQWQKISINLFQYPELAGAKRAVELLPDDFSSQQRKLLEKQQISSIWVLPDLRTGQGFCRQDGSYISDPLTLKKVLNVNEPVNNKVIGDSHYPSTCKLLSHYKNSQFSRLFGTFDPTFLPKPVRLPDESYFHSLYESEKQYLAYDPYLTIYWLLHFGLLFDDRYQEVLNIARQHNHALLSGAVQFFEDKHYQNSAAAYVYYDPDQEQLFHSNGQLLITTGNDAFRGFHSDYIHSYYRYNNFHPKDAIRALNYAMNNSFSYNALEKSLLLVEIAQKNNLWDQIVIPKQPGSNAFAWEFVRLHHPHMKHTQAQLMSWLNSLIKHQTISNITRLKSLKLLKTFTSNRKQLSDAIDTIKQQTTN